MDKYWKEIICGVIALLLAAWAYIFFSVERNVRDVRKEVTEHRIEVASDYSKKTEIQTILEGINARFDRIEDKLDKIITNGSKRYNHPGVE